MSRPLVQTLDGKLFDCVDPINHPHTWEALYRQIWVPAYKRIFPVHSEKTEKEFASIVCNWSPENIKYRSNWVIVFDHPLLERLDQLKHSPYANALYNAMKARKFDD